MKALITGFEPFGGDAINPSWEAARRLPPRVGKLDVVTACLPVSFRKAPRELSALLRAEKPHIVICTGLAADRPHISVERYAHNLMDARIPDNEGGQPGDEVIVNRGEPAFASTLPVTRIVDAMQRQDLKAEHSLSAGAFVCNRVFYGLMLEEPKHRLLHKAGFIHVPAVPASRAAQNKAIDRLTMALEIALEITRRSIN
jgi:pyroglutamyl-peptidase